MNRKQTVLAVDDSPLICQQIKEAFKNTDILIHQTHTGAGALEMVGSVRPDLILLDVILPDAEGYELIEKLREHDKSNAVIVFLTSKDSEQDVIRGFSLGARDYIKKPFLPEELRSRVMAHLQAKKQKDELENLNQMLKDNMEKLNTMVFRDELTGLYNRHYVTEKLQPLLEDESYTNYIVMADIDNFKNVNDEYGHSTGDMALVCISNIMEGNCRNHTAVRWGGEEFLLILRNVNKAQAYELCETIRKEVEEFPFVCGTLTFFCTITMGLARYRTDQCLKENVECADKALYEGKTSGKNRTVLYKE